MPLPTFLASGPMPSLSDVYRAKAAECLAAAVRYERQAARYRARGNKREAWRGDAAASLAERNRATAAEWTKRADTYCPPNN